MTRSVTLRAALLVIALGLVGAADAPLTHYELQQGSRFWIEGTSTVSPYTCAADRVAGNATLSSEHVAAQVAIPVRTFDCGVGAMNRDFYRALQGDAHPHVRFTLRGAELLDPNAAVGAWTPVRAYGSLELAGTARSVTIEAEGRQLASGQVQVRGSHALRMTHFGVDPPSGMLGLVRAHDRVVVRFDLTAAPSRGR